MLYHNQSERRRRIRFCSNVIRVWWILPVLMWMGIMYISIMAFWKNHSIIKEYKNPNTLDKMRYACTGMKRFCSNNPCCEYVFTENYRNICVPKNMTSYSSCPCGEVCNHAENQIVGVYIWSAYISLVFIALIYGVCCIVDTKKCSNNVSVQICTRFDSGNISLIDSDNDVEMTDVTSEYSYDS